ncbi:GNAT family N-acetyltransferase [Vibrio sp. S11_S32]|uniref:GNAT family N-acetyltransferase n=1 Tax=Vibrio sp. S11_S32 TaxID=2720225 RepID=UPI001680C199|nr:GNAT family N-acetyltransferase [Vibrio sp. S11_S32]MBD1575360.1 GNAT family N-acetyltransferase [Vibrio sp. S11_S32]
MKIIKASVTELDKVSHLFNLYRQFYGYELDMEHAKNFISQRLKKSDSIIFLALSDTDIPIGFVQLYPSLSSVVMKRMWYLNDLFVDESGRNQGVARGLLRKVKNHAIGTNAVTVKLATAIDNAAAQNLYESEGYLKVTAFDHYTQKVVQE